MAEFNPTRTRNEVLVKFVAPRPLKHDLQALAAARNVSLSALLRLVATEYVKRQR